MNRFGGGGQRTSAPALSADDRMQLDLQAAKQAPRKDPSAAMDSFLNKFNGLSEPFYFYHVDGKPTVTLVFDVKEHIYYRQYEDGRLEAQNGVSTIVHIIDKSKPLVAWASKMCMEKALRLMPTEFRQEDGRMWVKAITLEDFTVMMLEAKSAHKDRLEEAADIGHIAHGCLEDSIKLAIATNGGVVATLTSIPLDERAKNCAEAGLKWMQAHNVRWLDTERKIYSKKYKYAGTMDGRCIVDSCTDPLCCPKPSKDVMVVADWKSSNQLNIEYLYQTAAYEAAYEEEFGITIDDRWILRLGKIDGEFEPWHQTADDFEADFGAFLRCLDLVRAHEVVTDRMSAARKARTAARRAARLAEKERLKEIEKLEKALAKAEKKRLNDAKKLELKEKQKADRERIRAEKKTARETKAAALKAAKLADNERIKADKEAHEGICQCGHGRNQHHCGCGPCSAPDPQGIKDKAAENGYVYAPGETVCPCNCFPWPEKKAA